MLNPPTNKQYANHYDAIVPGLVLRVNSGGTKAWVVRHYRKGLNEKTGKRTLIPTTHRLGRYPILNVTQARTKARVFLGEPEKGLADAAAGNFREVADSFIKRYVDGHKKRTVPLRSKPEIERCLKRYILPVLGSTPFREIKRSDVTALLDQIEDGSGPRQADICLAIIRKMANWYATRNNDYVSPVVRGMNRTDVSERQRKRIFNDDEIRAFFTATSRDGTFGALCQVLLLTAQRREKVATMKWSDIVNDIVEGEWLITSEPREKSHAGSLRLTPKVLALMKKQPRIAGNPHVFAAGHGNGPFNSFSERKSELDQTMPPMPNWTLHDLRRTARSLMSRAKVLPHISERVLGHTIKGVEGTYDRYEYAEEKAEALKQLDHLIETIINPPQP
jgi:integrase